MSKCLECCDTVDVYVEVSELNDKFFITIERISDDTTQYLFEYQVRKILEYNDGYYIKLKRNKERVKFFTLEYDVGCFMKHKHGLFKKCYLVFHNNEKSIQKQVIK